MKLDDIIKLVGKVPFAKTLAVGGVLFAASPAYAQYDILEAPVHSVPVIQSTDVTPIATAPNSATNDIVPEPVLESNQKPYQWRDYSKKGQESVLHFAAEGGMRIFFDDNGTDLAATTSISGKVGYDTGFFGRLRLGFIDTLTSGDLPEVPGGEPSVDSNNYDDGWGNTSVLDEYNWNNVTDYFNGIFGEVEGGHSWQLGDGHLSLVVGGGVLRHHKDQRNWQGAKLSTYNADGVLLDQDPAGNPAPENPTDADNVVPAIGANLGVEGKYKGFTLGLNGGMVWDTDGSETRKGSLNLLLRYEF